MNKYQKAYDTIDTILHLMCGIEREDGYRPTQDEMKESMKILKKLVEKVTPKKQIVLKPDGLDFNVVECPNCHKILLGAGVARYCYRCGQRLDWSEDE